MTLSDNVKDVLRRIQNKVYGSADDLYVSFGGKVLRGSDEVMTSGIEDGVTLHAMSRVRDGGVHKSKMQTKQKKDNLHQRDHERQEQERNVKITWRRVEVKMICHKLSAKRS